MSSGVVAGNSGIAEASTLDPPHADTIIDIDTTRRASLRTERVYERPGRMAAASIARESRERRREIGGRHGDG